MRYSNLNGVAVAVLNQRAIIQLALNVQHMAKQSENLLQTEVGAVICARALRFSPQKRSNAMLFTVAGLPTLNPPGITR